MSIYFKLSAPKRLIASFSSELAASLCFTARNKFAQHVFQRRARYSIGTNVKGLPGAKAHYRQQFAGGRNFPGQHWLRVHQLHGLRSTAQAGHPRCRDQNTQRISSVQTHLPGQGTSTQILQAIPQAFRWKPAESA